MHKFKKNAELNVTDGILYKENFLPDPSEVFEYLTGNIEWDERMAVRKTASYGVAYNYSQISYPYQPLLPGLREICLDVRQVVGFEPNNCLINFYADGTSKMGFHSDQTDILEAGTGVVIISLGTTRTLRFRNIQNKDVNVDFDLAPGSLLYMTQFVQAQWQHAILRSDTDQARISLTLRRIKTNEMANDITSLPSQ